MTSTYANREPRWEPRFLYAYLAGLMPGTKPGTKRNQHVGTKPGTNMATWPFTCGNQVGNHAEPSPVGTGEPATYVVGLVPTQAGNSNR